MRKGVCVRMCKKARNGKRSADMKKDACENKVSVWMQLWLDQFTLNKGVQYVNYYYEISHFIS